MGGSSVAQDYTNRIYNRRYNTDTEQYEIGIGFLNAMSEGSGRQSDDIWGDTPMTLAFLVEIPAVLSR